MKPIQSPPGVAGAVKTRQRKRPDLTLPVPQRDVSLAVPLPLPPTSSGRVSAPSSGGSASSGRGSAPSSGGSASSSSSSSSMNSDNDSAAKNYSDLERGSKIGSGAGGKVYKVVHRPTSRVYALKVIHGNHEDTVRQQICREIQILHDVNHPNVVKCHEMFDMNGEIQVLLEFMDKGSLEGAHVWKEQQLSDLSRQVLCGLAYLHSRHIVHRDIKPSNLLINSAKNVKIADFGVSRVLAQTIEPCNSSVGTIAYMSPERINTDLNHGKYNGYAGDIWSLGVSILEFYLGRFPFPGGRQSDWSSLMCAICMAKPPEAPPTASPEFRHFISCCLQKDPAKRRSAMQLLQHPFILRASPNQNKSPQNLHQLMPPPRPLPSSSSPTTLSLPLST